MTIRIIGWTTMRCQKTYESNPFRLQYQIWPENERLNAILQPQFIARYITDKNVSVEWSAFYMDMNASDQMYPASLQARWRSLVAYYARPSHMLPEQKFAVVVITRTLPNSDPHKTGLNTFEMMQVLIPGDFHNLFNGNYENDSFKQLHVRNKMLETLAQPAVLNKLAEYGLTGLERRFRFGELFEIE